MIKEVLGRREKLKNWVDSQKKGCIGKVVESTIRFEENRKKVLFLNAAKRLFYRIQVDGGLVTEGLRCDHMLLDSEDGRTFYIELKGGDIPHAIEQLWCTVNQICPDASCCRTAMVIGKNHWPQTSPLIQREKKRFKRIGKPGVDLLVLNSVVKYDLSNGSCLQNQ